MFDFSVRYVYLLTDKYFSVTYSDSFIKLFVCSAQT